MGCGPSSAKGRDHYATLSPDPETLTPLVGSGGTSARGFGELNDFLTTEETAEAYIATKHTSVKKNRDFPVAPGYESAAPILPPASTPILPPAPPPPTPTPTASKPSGYVSSHQNTPSVAYSAANNNHNKTKGAEEEYELSFSDLRASDPLDSSSGFGESTNNKFSEFDEQPASPAPPSVQDESSSGIANGNAAGGAATTVSGAADSVLLDSVKSKGSNEKKSKKKKKSKSKSKFSSSNSSESKERMDDDAPQPNSKSGMGFDQLYRLKGVLGTGAFSTVREGYHRSSTTRTFAVKCVNRKKLSEEDEAALLDEVEILQELKHVHIIRLYDFFVEAQTYYLVMERMSGGELFDRIVAKAYYNEKEARDVCLIVLEAVRYCHKNNVAHRDLKPENLLLLSEHDDSTVKIADFGFAKRVYHPNSLTTQCGTPGYVAPEILEGIPYDQRADMWSVGVILYILLGGYPPFIENNQRDLFRKIRRGEYEFHEEYWGTVSGEAKELISSLLTVNPGARLTADAALRNGWIRGDDEVLAQRDLGANLKELTKFNAKRKFKAAVSAIIASNKLKSLGEDFLKNLS